MNYCEMCLNWHCADIPTVLKKLNIILLMWHRSTILYATFILFFCQESGLCTPIAGPRCNPYCEYHWWFTNVLLSCPWAGGVFKLLMASCWFTWKLFMGLFLFPIWILTAWGLGGERWRRSWCRCCFWSSPPPPLPPSSPSRPWSWRTRWWWRRGWEGTGGASWSPGWIRRDCQHPHRGTWTNNELWSMKHLSFHCSVLWFIPFIQSIILSFLRMIVPPSIFISCIHVLNKFNILLAIFILGLILSLSCNVSHLSCWLTSCSGTGWHHSSWSPCCRAQHA